MRYTIKTFVDAKDEKVKFKQISFVDWVIEKLEDYLLSEPDEDMVRCELYFQKGNETQRKTQTYKKPEEYVSQSGDDILRRAVRLSDIPPANCVHCGRNAGYLLDGFNLAEIEAKYCCYCGKKTR